jgi:phosphodiesterase/alkaline phosphatase D-like protein
MRGLTLLGALAALLSTPAGAQDKLDARLQLLLMGAPPSGAAAPLGVGAPAAASPPTPFFIRLRPGADAAALRARYPAGRFGGPIGGIMTGLLPLDQLAGLSQDPAVAALEGTQVLAPAMDVVRSSTNASGVWLGAIEASSTDFGTVNGSGTVVGIVDTGIDINHADFYTEGSPNKTRILAVWDQTDTGGPNPSGFIYGTEWTRAQLDDEIDGSPAGVVRQVDTDGHGTHVAGIAAGDGSSTDGDLAAGTFKGIAPDADIVMVKTTFSNADILDGLTYVVAKAAAAGKRVVINLSLGGGSGPHDGTSSFETGVAAVAASTPVIVAMGNDQGDDYHASTTTVPSGSSLFTLTAVSGATPLQAEFWSPSGDTYTVQVSSSASGTVSSCTAGNSCNSTIDGTAVAIVNTAGTHPSGDRQALIQLSKTGGVSPLAWRINLVRTANGGSGRLDGWIGTKNGAFTVFVDTAGTVLTPATANSVVAVGSYCSKRTWTADDNGGYADTACTAGLLGDISNFSTLGPTRDGRQKPDVAAPGQRVSAALSAGMSPMEATSSIAKDGRHRLINGTSMATPVVAGTVARMLQRIPAITASQIRSDLQAQARTDSKVTAYGAVPNQVFGYGKLSILACGGSMSSATVYTADVHGPSSMTWTWSSISGATSYTVSLATDPATLLGTPASATLLVAGLDANTTTAIRVAGVNDCGTGTAGNSPSTSTLPVPLVAFTPDVHATSATVSWTPLPAAPPAASAAGYRVEASTAANFTGTVFSSATPAVGAAALAVPGLSPLTSYYFRLGTLNDVGAPHYSGSQVAMTSTTLVVPSTGPFLAVSATSVTVSWGLSANPTGLLYVAQASTGADFSGTLVTSQTYALNAVMGPLSVNTTYFFRVRASTGANADLGALATLARAPVAAAEPFTAVHVTSAAVAWTSGGNPAGVRYQAEAALSPDFLSAPQSSVTLSTSALFTGLTANVTVYFRVTALNHASSTSAYTTTGSSATLAEVPAAAAVPFAAVHQTSAAVAWGDGGNPAGTRYRAEVAATQDFLTSPQSSVTWGTTAAFTGLASNTTFFFRVQALNMGGTPSPYAATLSSATLALVPGAGAPPFLSVFQTSAAVAWTSGGNVAGTLYRAELAASADFLTAPQSSETLGTSALFTGLTANTTHYLRVSALNHNSVPSPPSVSDSTATLSNEPATVAQPFPEVFSSSVTLAWTALPAAPPQDACEGYVAQASTAADFTGLRLEARTANPVAASLAVTTLIPGATYHFRVGSLNWNGQPAYTVLGTTRTTCGGALSAPTGFVSQVHGPSSMTWTWEAVIGAASYTVRQASSPATLFGTPESPTLLLTGLDANTTTAIQVAGVNDCGTGASADSPSTSTLAVPLASFAAAPHASSGTVSWTPLPPSPRAVSAFGYRAEAALAADFSGPVFSSATDAVGAASLAIPGLDALTSYYFRVGTLSESGAPHYAGALLRLTSTTLTTPGPGPFSAVESSSLTASWTLNGNPAGLLYIAQASTGSNFSGTLVTSQTYALSADFTGLTANTTYHFRVRASTGLFAALGSTTTLALPPASLAVPFTEVFQTSAAVAWATGGNSVGTRYRAEIAESADFLTAPQSSVTFGTSALFNSLAPNVTSYFRVTTLNHAGSQTAYTVTAATATIGLTPGPGAPPFPAVHQTSATVSWGDGGNPGGTRYRVELAASADFLTGLQSALTTSLSASFTGLSRNTTFYFRVASVNHNSVPSYFGPALSTSSLTSEPGTVGAPFAVVYPSSATVVWGALPAAPQSASCEGYLAEASTAADFSGDRRSAVTANPLAASLTVTGLTQDSTYFFRVGALNWNSVPVFTTAGSTRTAGLPAAAGPFTLVAQSSVVATWTANGNPLGTEYVATASTAPDFSGVILTSRTAGTSMLFAALSANTTYHFRVQPATGPFASLSSTVTLALDPGAAAVPFPAVFQTSMTVSWTGTGNPAGTRYRAELAADSGFTLSAVSSVTEGTSATFTGILKNTVYYLRVSALNWGSAPSGFAATQTTSTLTTAPTVAGSTFTGVFPSSVSVQWTALPLVPSQSSCEGYRLDASTAPNFSGRVVTAQTANASATGLTVTGLLEDRPYYFRVGSLNWNSVPTYSDAGSTRTVGSITSTGTVSGGAVVVTIEPSAPEISQVTVQAPPAAFPSGTQVTLTSAFLGNLPSQSSNQGSIAILSNFAGIDVSAGGAQPSVPVKLRFKLVSSELGAKDPRTLIVGRHIGSGWTLLPTTFDPAALTLEAETSHFSVFAPLVVTAGTSIDSLNAFPNPWKPGSGDPQFDAASLSFTNIPNGAEIRLFTILGEEVRSLNAGPSGIALWDGKNDNGVRVGSGTYLVVVSGAGSRRVLRVAVVR